MIRELKKATKRFLNCSGALRFVGRFVHRGTVILRYHSVQEEPELHADTIGYGIIHASSVFADQMEILSRKFSPVSLNDILAYTEGRKNPPRRAVAVTFDDGFADNATVAAPIMERFGISGVFYLTVTAIDDCYLPWFVRLRRAFRDSSRKIWAASHNASSFHLNDPNECYHAFIKACEICACLTGEEQRQWVKKLEETLEVQPFSPAIPMMMNWDQICRLRKAGHIIGSHTMTHPNIAYISSEEVNAELAQSKAVIEGHIGEEVIHFSYPAPILEPHWNSSTVEIARHTGYRSAVTSTSGIVRKKDDPLFLKRIAAPTSIEDFCWKLDAAFLGKAG